MTDDVLHEVLLELRQIRELLAAGAAAPRAGRVDDVAALGALLPAVWDSQADRTFAVADLVADQVIDAGDAQRVGRLLGRNAGVRVGDLVLHSVGDDYAGRLWCIRRMRL